MYFWVPQSGSMGVGVSLLSYAGKVFVGMIADRALIPEPGQVVGRFGPEFERLLLATTVGVLARTRPPAKKSPRQPRSSARRTSAAPRRRKIPAGST
jgi:hypothetical protein